MDDESCCSSKGESSDTKTEVKDEKSTGAAPVCIIVLGMAGSGKTTFVQRLTAHLHRKNNPPYVINLDPACRDVPYPVNIDIRDTVKYKEVMKHYSLGPNGAIVTSLNLFAMKFDQVIDFIHKRQTEREFFIFDTPGQIEVFTWSASGTIITETLAAIYPTVVVYVMDTVRNVNPITFMSNMLYACSILYKMKLPFIVAMNKVDVVDNSFAIEWMNDFTLVQAALEGEPAFSSSLMRSMSFVLDEFYKDLKSVGVSAVTGQGIDEFFGLVSEAAVEYERDYKAEFERCAKETEAVRLAHQHDELRRVEDDYGEGDDLLITSRPDDGADGSAFLISGNMLYDNDDDTSDEEQRPTGAEIEDEDEKKEYESFKAFLKNPNPKDRVDDA